MAKDKSFFRNFAEEIKDEDTSLAADGEGSAEFTGWVDTGCYMLNAVLSGSLYGGLPNNKISGFAGETSTGKTFFALALVKHFLEANPNAGVVYYDTEAAVTKDMLIARGVDVNRTIIAEPDTIQKFRTHAINVVDKYMAVPADKRPPMMMILDSLGMLSTSKEIEDTAAGKDTRDMTKAQIIKATFRVLTLKLARARIPMIVTNHTYDVIGSYFPTQEISGGSGFKYAASTIAMLSKSKDKDGTEVVGNIIKVKMFKSRLSRENAMVAVKLSYTTGLDKYYGLLELAEKAKVFKKVSTQYELPDGTKVFGKKINEEPEKYYTPEVMAELEKAAKEMYSYGSDVEDEPEEVVTKGKGKS